MFRFRFALYFSLVTFGFLFQGLSAQSTVSFRNGQDGYSGTQDTTISSTLTGPFLSNAVVVPVSQAGGAGEPQYGLIQFENIIGSGSGMIPEFSTIVSARLSVHASDAGHGFEVYRMTTNWEETALWSDFGGNGLTGDIDTTAVDRVGFSDGSGILQYGTIALDVTAAVQAWASGEANYGLALFPFTDPAANDSVAFSSSEEPTANLRPVLEVTYLPPTSVYTFQNGENGYTGAEDYRLNRSIRYDDSKLFVGVGSNDGTTYEIQSLIRFNDIVGNNPDQVPPYSNIGQATITFDVTNDGSGFRVFEMLQDWALRDKWDSFEGGDGIQTDNIVARSQQTASVGANNGNDNVDLGLVELDITRPVQNWVDEEGNFGLALLPFENGTELIYIQSSNTEYTGGARPLLTVVVEQTTKTFEQGVDGYSSLVDTEVRESAPDSNLSDASTINVDSDDGVGGRQGLIRFDNIIGSSEIPKGSTISHATLQLNVTEPGNRFRVHRMLSPWSESSTWNTLDGGIQPNNIEAESAVLVQPENNSTQGTILLDITDAVQAWASGEDNHGLVLRPVYSNNHQFWTSESGRGPKLFVAYTEPSESAPNISLVTPADGANDVGQGGHVTLTASVFKIGAVMTTTFYGRSKASDPWVELDEQTVDTSIGGLTRDLSFSWTGLDPDTSYQWYAEVTDGISVIRTSPFTFTTEPNLLPIAVLTAPANSQVFDLGVPITLSANATDTAPGTVTKVEFLAGSIVVGEDLTAPYSFEWLPAEAGTFLLSARATDNQNGVWTSASTAVTIVEDPNVAPSVMITSPATGAFIGEGDLEITVDVADTDGLVTLVEFYDGVDKIGESSTAPFSFIWSNVTSGSYSLTAVATDNDLDSTTSTAVDITVLPVALYEITFQQGLNGYSGAADTYLYNKNSQGIDWAARDHGDDYDIMIGWIPSRDGLLRFDDISGSGDDQIPPGSSIQSATLGLNVIDPGSGVRVHRMLADWTDTATYSGYNGGGGVDADGSVAEVTALDEEGLVNIDDNVPAGPLSLDVTTAVQGWVDNSFPNYGVALLTMAGNTMRFDSSEWQVVSERPKLTVRYWAVSNLPPVIESFEQDEQGGFVRLKTMASDPDGSVVKIEYLAGDSVIGEVTSSLDDWFEWLPYTGNHDLKARVTDNRGTVTESNIIAYSYTNPSNNPPAVTLNPPVAGTSLAPGDITVTIDASDSDGFITTIELYNGDEQLGELTMEPYEFLWQDVAVGQYTLTAVATDNDGGVSTSSLLVLTAKPAITVEFQNGVNGYSGSSDTQIEEYTPDTNHGSKTLIAIESISGQTTQNQGLLKFDSILGTADNQVPAGSTIASATIQLNVINEGPGIDLHRMLVDWTDGDTWNSLGQGVHRDDSEAEVSAYLRKGIDSNSERNGRLTVGLHELDVTSAVQDWVDGGDNYGFALFGLPTGGWDAVDFDSNEAASVSLRPKLTVTYLSEVPIISILATDAVAGEYGADTSLEFLLSRTGNSLSSLDILPMLISGTATPGVDFIFDEGSPMFGVGEATHTLTLTVLEDTEIEGDETLELTISPARPEIAVGVPATAQAVISDHPVQSYLFSNISDPALRAPELDADADGVPNLVEYYTGTLLESRESFETLALTKENAEVSVIFTRKSDAVGVVGKVEWSTNLDGQWHQSGESDGNITVTYQETITPVSDSDTEQVSVLIESSGTALPQVMFFRLSVNEV